jgi:hypothetical protein
MLKRLAIVALLIVVLFLVRNRNGSGFNGMVPAGYNPKTRTFSCSGNSVLSGNMCFPPSAAPKPVAPKPVAPAPAAPDYRPARQAMGCPYGKKKSKRGSFCIEANSTDDRTNTIRSGTGLSATYSCPSGTYPAQAGLTGATTKCWPNETPVQIVFTCPDKNYPKLIENKCFRS